MSVYDEQLQKHYAISSARRTMSIISEHERGPPSSFDRLGSSRGGLRRTGGKRFEYFTESINKRPIVAIEQYCYFSSVYVKNSI